MTTEKKHIALIFFNLGGPDRAESIAPFLKNFFMDPLILRVSWPLRFVLSRLIAYRRSRSEAGASYGALGGASPLLANSEAQAQAVEKMLNQKGNALYRSFVCMRYWHPMSNAVASQVKNWAPDQIILLPFYPQFSTTTTESSFRDWDKSCKKIGLSCPTVRLCCYPYAPGYITQSAQHLRAAYDGEMARSQQGNAKADKANRPRILFSAHGLPENVIAAGDPYQYQCEESAAAIIRAAGLEEADWVICYQSRIGPRKWIGPSTEEEVRRAGKDRVPLIIYPHAFVNEHVETLVEIEEEYRALALQEGVPSFTRVETVGTGTAFINGLADLVLMMQNKSGTCTANPEHICPEKFCECRLRRDQK